MEIVEVPGLAKSVCYYVLILYLLVRCSVGNKIFVANIIFRVD